MADQELWRGFRAALALGLERTGLKQHELAKRVGVSPSSVHGWLHEMAIPHGENLMTLARVLGVQPDDLVPGSGRAAPTRGGQQSAYVSGGRAALDELELCLRELRARWDRDAAQARGAAASAEAVARAEREQPGQRRRKGS